MTRHAIPSDPAAYPCAFVACERTPVVVTTGDAHPAVFGHCPDHLPGQVTFPLEPLEEWANQGR